MLLTQTQSVACADRAGSPGPGEEGLVRAGLGAAGRGALTAQACTLLFITADRDENRIPATESGIHGEYLHMRCGYKTERKKEVKELNS